MNKRNNDKLSDALNEFAFEKKSSTSQEEIVEEIATSEDREEITEEIPKAKTIKIISEKDIQYKKAPPPNFSSKFKCILHYKGGKYRKRKVLDIALKENQ